MKNAIFTFGRFNPPTIGHMLLIASMKRVAAKNDADVVVFTGASQDKTRNPLNYKNKISIMKKVFKGTTVVNSTKVKTIFNALEYLDTKKYNNITLVVGSDRVSELKTLIGRYLDNYNFKSFNVVSAGDRDPDAEGAVGMSASKMRAAAKVGDFNTFKLGVPETMNSIDMLKTFKLVQKGMGVKHFITDSWFDYDEFKNFINEAYSIDERVVSMQARRKMAQSARRTAKKRAKTRKRKEKKMKSKSQLVAKSQKDAKNVVRKKMLGDVDWNSLSIGARMQFDKKLANKTKLISKIAKKLYPKIKVAEKERIQKLRVQTPGQPTTKLEEDTFKKRAVRKANSELDKETERINKEIEKIKHKQKGIGVVKGLKDRLAVVRKKKEEATKRREEAEKRIKASKKRLAALRSKLKEDYAKLKDRRAYLKKTVKQRTARTLARRKMEKEGKCRKGDNMDVDHKNGNPLDNSTGNLRVMRRSKNRGRDNNKWRTEEHGAGEEGTDKLLKAYLKDTPNSNNIDKKFKNRIKKNGK